LEAVVESRRQALSAVERQTAMLMRHFELLNRRTDVHQQLDRSEYLLLRALEEGGAMNINALASLLGLDPSTAGRQIAGLQRAGLVERAPDPSDRRCTVITPTAEGLERMRHVRRQRTEFTADLLAGWTDEELRTFDTILGKYNRTVAKRYLTGPGAFDLGADPDDAGREGPESGDAADAGR
jgi:DNA-binding MarR family transcriptional regulator